MTHSFISKLFILSLLCCSTAHAQNVRLPYPDPTNKCEREANALVTMAEQVETCDNATDWYKRYLKLYGDCPTVVKAADALYYRANEQVRVVSLYKCSSDVHHSIQSQLIAKEERQAQQERRASKDGLSAEEREERDEDALEARRKLQTARNLKIFDVDNEDLFLKFTNEVLYLFEQSGYKLRDVSTPSRLNSFKDNTKSSSDYKSRSLSQVLYFENDMKVDVEWEYSNTDGDKKQIYISPKNEQDFQELVQRKPYKKIANLVEEKQDLTEAKSWTGTFLVMINKPVIARLQYEANEMNPILKARFEGKPVPTSNNDNAAKISEKISNKSVKEVCDLYLNAINAKNPTQKIADMTVTFSSSMAGGISSKQYIKLIDNYGVCFSVSYIVKGARLIRNSVTEVLETTLFLSDGETVKATPEGHNHKLIEAQFFPEMSYHVNAAYEQKVTLEEFAGKTCYCISTKPIKDYDFQELTTPLSVYSSFYDVETGQKLGGKFNSGNELYVFQYTGYKIYNGVTYPIRLLIHTINSLTKKQTEPFESTIDYEFNTGIDEEMFEVNTTKYNTIAAEPAQVIENSPAPTKSQIPRYKPTPAPTMTEPPAQVVENSPTPTKSQIPRYKPAPAPTMTEPPAQVVENSPAPTKSQIPRYNATPAPALTNPERPAIKELIEETPIPKPVAKAIVAQPVTNRNNATKPLEKSVVNEAVVKLKECFGNTLRLEVFESSSNRKIGLIVFGNLKEGENKYIKLDDTNAYHAEGKVYAMHTTEQLKLVSIIETTNPFYFINGTFLAKGIRFIHKDENRTISYFISKISLSCE